jgi:Cu/Ag efflux pump CusA
MGSRAGLEIIHPLAVVLLGGLVTTLIMTLFVIPSLYLHFARPYVSAQELGSERHAAH